MLILSDLLRRETEIFEDPKTLKEKLNISQIYPKDEIWTPEIIEAISNEIKSDLVIYAFPSARLSYLDIENRIGELLNLNHDDLMMYIEKSFLLRSRILSFVFRLPQKIREVEQYNDSYISKDNRISGKIDWVQTLKGNHYSPRIISKFHVHSIERTHNTSANRVLKDCISSLFHMTSKIIKYFRLTEISSLGWQSIVLENNSTLKNSLKFLNYRFPQKNVHSNDYFKAANHKMSFYREAAKIGHEIRNFKT
ncbi:MAG: hypothetical protein ACXABG_16635, partial [Promethearchaeota archaeon]